MIKRQLEAMKAFESVMKTILVRKKWSYDERDTASKLINSLFENGIVDKNLQTHLTSLKTTLKGLSTIRNRTSDMGKERRKKRFHVIWLHTRCICAQPTSYF
jgi:hypothetical protein